MSEWWQSLSLAQQIFYGVAIVSTAVLIIQIVLGMIGGDHNLDLDFESGHHSSGLGVVSLQSVATFLAGFGWGGVLWLNRGFGLFVAVVSGTVVGAVMMAAMVFLMRSLLKMEASGTLDYHNAVGETATVYCPIPAGLAPGGQIEVLLQGRLIFADAVTDASEALRTGAKVRITGLRNTSTFVVEPL